MTLFLRQIATRHRQMRISRSILSLDMVKSFKKQSSLMRMFLTSPWFGNLMLVFLVTLIRRLAWSFSNYMRITEGWEPHSSSFRSLGTNCGLVGIKGGGIYGRNRLFAMSIGKSFAF